VPVLFVENEDASGASIRGHSVFESRRYSTCERGEYTMTGGIRVKVEVDNG
jgi:hypothetical protein